MKYLILSLLLVGCNYYHEGPKGEAGAPGEPCKSEVVTNGVVITCPKGQNALLLNGAPGVVGPQGIQGLPGKDGVDAFSTQVLRVQFCPSQGATTYGHFPEYGLSVDGVILAVYYDGSSAWLAEIVPGIYRSTATGLNCNFSVHPGGTVIQN